MQPPLSRRVITRGGAGGYGGSCLFHAAADILSPTRWRLCRALPLAIMLRSRGFLLGVRCAASWIKEPSLEGRARLVGKRLLQRILGGSRHVSGCESRWHIRCQGNRQHDAPQRPLPQ
jgi:hypothetical protein